MTNCKWCGDQTGGCLYCYNEIQATEQETTERIASWQPPPPELFDCIRARAFPRYEGETIANQVAQVVLLDRLSRMSDADIEQFIIYLQTPPPVFKADQRDPVSFKILKRYFNANSIGDCSPETVQQRGEAARIAVKMEGQFSQRHGLWPTRRIKEQNQ